MEELDMYLFVYGYLLPLVIMVVWMVYRIYSDLKVEKIFVSHYLKDWWPILLPGVSLWGACALLLIAISEGSDWLERHWEPWRMAGGQSRRMMRRLLGEIKED